MNQIGTASEVTFSANTISNLSLPNSISSNNYYSLHYVSQYGIDELVDLTGDTEHNSSEFTARFPLFFESQNTRYVPNKLKVTIERYCDKEMLRSIHPEEEVAVELCLVFLSNLSNAYYTSNSTSGWKKLYSKILRDQVSNRKESTYLKIIKLLQKGTKQNGPILERSNQFTIGKESYRYRLTDVYRNKGVKKYEFQTQHVRNLISKIYFQQLNAAMENPIGKNLIKFYQMVELPSLQEIKAEAKRLIKAGYITKKGKILTKLNKHKKEYFKDWRNRSFVEENIILFQRLTEDGFLIPTINEENAGGRVTDSFNLMPSWIRNLCKINGQPIQECDFSALHPNLAVKIYGGNTKYISHQKVAETLSMDVKMVKIQHLSFFNLEVQDLAKNPLFDYYTRNEPEMMERMFQDKIENDHTSTSRKMFRLETQIMTSVIEQLNHRGIFVMYVYDALYTTPKNQSIVIDLMNEEALKMGVYTSAK